MINLEFENAFNSVKFRDSDHSYESNDKPLISVTTYIKKLKEPFNHYFWLVYKCLEYSNYKVSPRLSTNSILVDGQERTLNNAASLPLVITPEQLETTWKFKTKTGVFRGSLTHAYMESLFRRQERSYDYPSWVSELSTKEMSQLHGSIVTLKKLGNDFYNTIINTHVPVLLEYTIGDEEMGIAGTFDMLLYSKEDGTYSIWDFKTDRKFETTSKYKLKLFNVPDCEMNKYSIQTSMYRYIIEKNTTMKISGCYAVYLDWQNDNYRVIELTDYREKIHNVFTNK